MDVLKEMASKEDAKFILDFLLAKGYFSYLGSDCVIFIMGHWPPITADNIFELMTVICNIGEDNAQLQKK